MTQVELAKDQVPEQLPRRRKLQYDALLVLVTMIWGGTFLVVKDTLKLIGPFTFLALCYAVGTLVLATIFRKRLAHLTRAELIKGMLIGVFLFAGYALQTNGLRYTTVSKAGFITGLYVPLVAAFSFLFLRQKPTLGAIAGMLLSLLGLCLLSIDRQFNFAFGLGELLILGCAFAFALQIVGISKFVSGADAINLAIVQLALTSLLSFLAIPIAGEPIAMPPLLAWGSIVFMGVIDMAFCIFAMNWVQQYLSSTRAALIYALEPVWAGVFDVLLAGDSLSVAAWMGCVCIFLAMIISELRLAHVMKLLSR